MSMYRIPAFVVLLVFLAGCGGNVDRIVESPLERDTGIGVSRGDRPPAQGVPTWTDIASGSFAGNATGTAVVYEKAGFRNLRLEQFSSQDCEQARVYLAADDERVDLGALQKLQGDQGYGIPSFVDIDEYSDVVVWCDTGGVILGSARLE